MKFIGYDSYTSWIITVGCSIIHCTAQTPYRIAGLLYVAIIDYYETDRETASIPILIFIVIRCLGGFFCGVLGEKLGAENVTLYGSILAAVGVGGCIFAKNILGLSIFLGLVYGLGMTGSNTLIPSILKKYFKKNITTVNGIAAAGPCLGAILIPPLAVFLLDKYSLPGMFLITSALMLHAVPISLIMKQEGLIQDKIIVIIKQNNELVHQERLNNQKSLPEAIVIFKQENVNNQESLLDSLKNTYTSNQLVKVDNKSKKSLPSFPYNISEENEKSSSDSSTVTNLSGETSNNGQRPLSVSSTKTLKLSEENNYHPPSKETSCATNDNVVNLPLHNIDQLNSYIKDATTLDLKQKIVLNSQNFNTDSNVTNINKISLLSEVKASSNIMSDSINETKEQIIATCSDISFENPSEGSPKSNKTEINKSLKKSNFLYIKVFINPQFLSIMLSTGLYNYVSVLVSTTMIDYSRDKGIPREYEVYFLMMHPLCEMIGRICFGWVTDLGYLSIFKYSVLCFSIMGLTNACVLVSADFWMMMLGALTFAISSGCMTAVFPGMVFAYVPEDLQMMAIASRYALSGPLIFTSAPLIGFFREKQGSYDGLYILFIAISGSCVAIMILMSKFSSHGKKSEA